ncbi:MAG: HesA/MoeB/ThiF family protein [Pseudomonadota bacterium]
MTQGLRYARQVALSDLGENGQAKLAAAHVLIIGLGGLGTPAAAYLAAAGIGQLSLNDFDSVDATNLARQFLYRESDQGQSKAEVLAERLNLQNPACISRAITNRLSAVQLNEAVANCDLVLDCSDNFQTRQLINKACIQNSRLLISGAAIRLTGQLFEAGPDFRQAPCYECVYPAGEEGFDDCQGNGILGPVTGTIGSMMATRALLRLTGNVPVGGLLLYDASQSEWQQLKIRKNPDCVACSG